jgi:hypothetical protein
VLRRSSIIAFEIVAGLIAGAVILLGVALWRISGDEPLRVSFLTPYLEQALTPADGRFSVAIEDTVLTWAGWERTLDLRARGVQAIAEDGSAIASVSQVSLTLSLRALLRGMVAPTSIEVFGPHLFLRREADGHFTVAGIAPPEGGGPVAGGGNVFGEVMAELQDEPEPNSLTGYLSRVSIVGGRVTLEDRRLGMNWQAPEANFSVRRGPAGLTGEISLAVDQLGRPARFAARFDFDRASETIGIGGSFTGLDVPALGLVESSFMALEGVDMRLQGNFTTRIGLNGRIATTRFDLTGGPGQIAVADAFDAPVPLRRVSMRGTLEAGGDTLVIESAVADLGGPQLAAQVTISGLVSGETPKTGGLRVSGHLSAGNISVASLGQYWPKTAARGAREWVIEHITEGVADAGEVDFALRVLGGDGTVAIERLEGSFDASGATVHYKKPLPPIVDAAGHASFTDKQLVVDFTQGRSEGLTVHGGQTRITGLDQEDQIIEVDGTASGPLANILMLLDHPTLGYASRLGIDPAAAGGTARADLSFRIPAEKDVTFDDVKMAVKGEASDVTLGGAFFGHDVAGRALTVDLDNDGMDVAGDILLAGAELAMTWRENFDDAAFQSRFVLDGSTTAAQRAELGLDLRPRFDGPLSGQVVLTRVDATHSVVDADLDLVDLVVDMPELVWRKAAGEPGHARFAVDLVDGRAVALRELSATAGTLTAEGRLGFAPDGESLASIEMDSLTFGKSRLNGVSVLFTPSRPEITIAGGVLDAEPMLEQQETASTDTPAAGEGADDALLLRAALLDRVILAEGREVANVSAALDHDGSHWQRILIDGELTNGSAFSMHYEPEPGTDKLKLLAIADDAGEALRAFDVFDNVEGGRLTVTGEALAADPRRTVRGKAEISQFRVVRAPALARLLTIATLTGFVDLLTGDGLLFTRFTSDFAKADGRLDVPLARAYGPSLGLTATGHIDFDADVVDLEGTIAPAYVLNSILGNIPVIGNLLQGGKGEAVFAATYKARGSLEQPEISVNPLSALAPGFLRGLFDIFDGSGQTGTPRALPEPGNNK